MDVARLVLAQAADPPSALLTRAKVVYEDANATQKWGVNTTRRVVLEVPDGSLIGAYRKTISLLGAAAGAPHAQSPKQQRHNEVIARLLAVGLGEPWKTLVPPTALVDHPRSGRPGGAVLVAERPGGPASTETIRAVDDDTWRAAALFDWVSGQQDRHAGNLLWLQPNGPLSLIDHGYAFRGMTPIISGFFYRARRKDPGARLLSQHEIDTMRALADSDDLFGVGDLLSPWRAAKLRSRAQRAADSQKLP